MENIISLLTFSTSFVLFFFIDCFILIFKDHYLSKVTNKENNIINTASCENPKTSCQKQKICNKSNNLDPDIIEHLNYIKRFWKYRNTFLSFIHASISSCWIGYLFYCRPDLLEDLISLYDIKSLGLVCFSLGYFCHDSFHLLRGQKSRESMELLSHHLVIFICFGIAVVQKLYVGFAVVALLVEVNSVFLHLRPLLRFWGFSKRSSLYRTNSVLNIGTFILFRVVTLAWMTRWLVTKRSVLPGVMYSVGGVGLAIINVMNIVLLCRLVWSDFLSSPNKDE